MKYIINALDYIEFNEIILGAVDHDADDDEVNNMVNRYMHMGFLLDRVFSIARTRCGELSNESTALIRRMIKAVLNMWRNLQLSMRGPKIHGMEDHLVEQMVHYDGIGDFTEDFVEQSHQHEVRDELRTIGLKRSRAFVSHSEWEWKRNQIGIEEARKIMHEKTSKKKRKTGVVEKEKEEK